MDCTAHAEHEGGGGQDAKQKVIQLHITTN